MFTSFANMNTLPLTMSSILAPTPPVSTSTTFSLFPLLAPEMRLKIWQHACAPRTVSLIYFLELDRCYSSSKPPAILQANHESRTEALRTYTLSFGTGAHPAKIYFNPYRDTLYLPRFRQMGYDETLRDFRSFMNLGEAQMLDEIRSIAIDHVDPTVKRPWEAYNKAALMRGFPKLEEVIMVLSDGEGNPGLENDMQLMEPRGNPEDLFRLWAEFKQTLVAEESVLEDIRRVLGREYVNWTLPTVKIRVKSSKVTGVEERNGSSLAGSLSRI